MARRRQRCQRHDTAHTQRDTNTLTETLTDTHGNNANVAHGMNRTLNSQTTQRMRIRLETAV